MNPDELVNTWFKKWEIGDFKNLPIAHNFNHTSPFGIIKGKKSYIDLVNKNKDKFLGYKFNILDKIFNKESASVRYIARQGKDFTLNVSEWYYFKNGLIESIIAYYHIGDIKEDRKLK